jgi:hypothetical protein
MNKTKNKQQTNMFNTMLFISTEKGNRWVNVGPSLCLDGNRRNFDGQLRWDCHEIF